MITIRTTAKTGVISGKFQASDFALLREMYGRCKWKDGKFFFELSSRNVTYLHKHMPFAVWEDSDPLEKAKQQELQIVQNIQNKLDDLPKEAFHFEYKTKPFKHQEKAFFLCRDRDTYGLFLEMGTGKTKIGFDKAAYMWGQDKIDTLLITAPNGVHAQWITEQLATHLPDWVEYETLVYVSPSSRKVAWKKDAEKCWLANKSGKLRIVAMHYEAFAQPKGVLFAERLLRTGRALWILDESHRIKSHKAKRTREILRLSTHCKYKLIMSGAPITQGIQDLYTQFKFLDPDILGFNSFTTFRNYFCHVRSLPNTPFGVYIITGYQNVDELQRLVDGYTYRVTKKECLDLPEKTYLTRPIELTKEQKRAYNQMKEHLVAQLEDGSIVDAPSALVQLIKLQQIICGFGVDEEGVKVPIKNNRVNSAISAVQDIQGKVVIWCRFHYDFDVLQAALDAASIKWVEYSGRINTKDKAKNKQAFIEDPTIKVFIANAKAGGTGTDGLQTVADTAIYYSNTFSADDRWQSEDRTHRIGMGSKSTYIDMVCAGTIDTKILSSLKEKKNVANSVLDVKTILQNL